MEPLVSILTATYNAELFLADAIESVLSSSYSNWELIIVDDNSNDKSLEIARHFEKLDNRIKVFKNEINLGDYPNRNKAASYAKGKYLKYLDNDDILYTYSLAYMVDAMEKFPNAVLGLSFSLVDDDYPYPIYNSSEQTYRAEFLGKGFLSYGPSASIICRDAFEKVGGFCVTPFVGDQNLWLRLSLNSAVVKLQPALIWYRVHAAQESKREKKNIINQHVRYNVTLDAFNNGKHFFTQEEINYIFEKIKRNQARLILKNMIYQRKIIESVILWKKCNLSFTEILSGFKGYLK